MTHYKFALALISIFITGCAYKPSPYLVVDSLPYKKGYMQGFYKEGVTEEAIKQNNAYKVTVKLDSGSSKARAEDMLLLHAANLTIASGSETFMVRKLHSSTHCYYGSKDGQAKKVKNYSPMARAFITIVQKDTPKKLLKGKQLMAQKVKAEKESIVNKITDKSFVKETRAKHLASCISRYY